MPVRRIIPYYESRDPEASRAFYTQVLGLDEGEFGGGYIGFGSGQARVLFAPPGVEPIPPNVGIDVGTWDAVDEAHTAPSSGITSFGARYPEENDRMTNLEAPLPPR